MRCVCIRLSLVIAACSVTAMMGQTPTATLQGTVQDATGAFVPDTRIVITNVATNEKREVSTDSAGRYVQPFLLPGTYTITAEKVGFRTVVQQNVKLEVGQNRSVDLTLEIGTVTRSEEHTSELQSHS